MLLTKCIHIILMLTFVAAFHVSFVLGISTPKDKFFYPPLVDLHDDNDQSAKIYLLFSHFSWEQLNNQLISILNALVIARNISATVVIPPSVRTGITTIDDLSPEIVDRIKLETKKAPDSGAPTDQEQDYDHEHQTDADPNSDPDAIRRCPHPHGFDISKYVLSPGTTLNGEGVNNLSSPESDLSGSSSDPNTPSSSPSPRNPNQQKISLSLLGDYFDLDLLNQFTPVITMKQFLRTDAYAILKECDLSKSPNNSTPVAVVLPRAYDFYRSVLKLSHIGTPSHSHPRFMLLNMSHHISDMHTKGFKKCYQIPATLYKHKQHIIIFLDKVYYYQFCAERYFPDWYTLRKFLQPRSNYFQLVQHWFQQLKKPPSKAQQTEQHSWVTLHLRDLKDGQVERNETSVHRYAYQIAYAVANVHQQLFQASTPPAFYFSYAPSNNTQRLKSLLVRILSDFNPQLFKKHPSSASPKFILHSLSRFASEPSSPSLSSSVLDSENTSCHFYQLDDIFMCHTCVSHHMQSPTHDLLEDVDRDILFRSRYGVAILEMVVAIKSGYFIGNAASTFSRNVALYKILAHNNDDQHNHFALVIGFGERRHLWDWTQGHLIG